MKFLRLSFYVLIAQLVLSGCAGEGVEETSSSSSSEINFDAYLGRNASTRAGVTDIASLKGSGFGVFARYNHNGATSPLMDNERVTWNEKENRWGYTNTRYWPNEGSVDFYAFAPYLENVELVKDPKSNDANPTYIEFTSSESNVDLVWGAQTDQKAPTSSTDGKVKFEFKHALARLGFDITANQKLEENGAVIIVNKVKLYGKTEDEGAFDIKGYLNLEDGTWSRSVDVGTRAVYTWTPTGAEDGTGFKLIASQLDHPCQLDHTCEKIENAPNSYLCIIPQDKWSAFYLQITYTVQQGNFEEEVTVKKNLLEVLQPEVSDPSFEFVKGKAYVFHLKLSLDPINFNISATVVDFVKVNNE